MADGSGKVSFQFGDGTYDFRLPLGQLRELQDKTDAGPLELHRRITGGTWRVDDLREIIRLGLIGGGTSPTDALKLVARYVDDRPLNEAVAPAAMILYFALIGPEDDPAGKAPAAQDQEIPNEQTESSPSPPSTEPEPQSV